jgi:hypothetical protein
MRAVLRLFSSRRGFLSGLAAVMPAVFLGRPRQLQAARAEVKDLLSQLELESLRSGRPRRSLGFNCSGSGAEFVLRTRTDGTQRSVCVLNETGKFIWEACDGEHTIDEISKRVHETFLVTQKQARIDLLGFLWTLKARGAIQ